LSLAVLMGKFRFLTLLLFAGADPYLLSEGENTPRNLAETLGEIGIVRFLDEQLCSLHRAALAGDLDTVRRLILHGGVEVNSLNHNGEMALHLALAQGHLSVVRFLVDVGASLREKNASGRNAEEIAASSGHPAIVHFFRVRAYIRAIESGNLQEVRSATAGGVAVTQLVDYGGLKLYPLCRAAYLGHVDVVDYLIRVGAEVNLEGLPAILQPLSQALAGWAQSGAQHLMFEDESGEVQLSELATQDQFPKRYHQVALALIRAGATITYEHMKTVMEHFDDPMAFPLLQAMIIRVPQGTNIEPSEGMDPRMPLLCVAILQKTHADQLINLLLGWGARVDLGPDYEGYQPIHVAAAVGNTELVRFLLSKGVDVNRVGPGGVTALHSLVIGAYRAALGLGFTHTHTLEGVGQFYEAAEVLLGAGVSPWVQDREGQTPLALAERIDRKGVIDERLIDLLRGVERPDEDVFVVEAAIDQGGDLNLLAHPGLDAAMPSGVGINRES